MCFDFLYNFRLKHFSFYEELSEIKCVPLVTEPDISLIILPLMRILLLRVAKIRRTTDTFLFISHTTNNIFIGVRIIKEMPGFGSEWDTLYNDCSVASGTQCIMTVR